MYMTSSVDQIISPEPYDRLAQPVDNRVRITFTLQTDLEEHGLRWIEVTWYAVWTFLAHSNTNSAH